MKTRKIAPVFAASMITALLVSVSFTEDGPSVVLGGEEVCADTVSCHAACENAMEECAKGVKKETRLGACLECCKDTEKKGFVPPMNAKPTRDELHQHMLDKCVFPGFEAVGYSRGFPTELHAAERFDTKHGRITDAVRKLDKHVTSTGSDEQGPRSATESACVKGCTYRTKRGMEYCQAQRERCTVLCPAPSGSRCGK